MVKYDPESFNRPVRDYSFQDIRSPDQLFEQMSEAGGFTATKLAKARDILAKMFEDSETEGCVKTPRGKKVGCVRSIDGMFEQCFMTPPFWWSSRLRI